MQSIQKNIKNKDLLLDVNNLNVYFDTTDGRIQAVKNANLFINKGECLGIVGESGSGKTQTFFSITGLLSSNGYCNGSAIFKGFDLISASENKKREILGKSIGFIIILIGISGFLFSVYKIYTLREQEKVIASDNASVILEMENIVKDVTNYESKENTLDEFIINYTGKLEWGANWVKFFAAVAPLLGLLGTVIGMIETFQAITLFGTGDPKQMAGGISQALVTTMLGLIVAAPLLGLYTYISQKVSNLSQVLEEKASYLLAKN